MWALDIFDSLINGVGGQEAEYRMQNIEYRIKNRHSEFYNLYSTAQIGVLAAKEFRVKANSRR
jgi:hypothetical protein